MSEVDSDGRSRRISLDLPNEHITHIDLLKKEWGLRARGDVLKRLLEEILPAIEPKPNITQPNLNLKIDLECDRHMKGERTVSIGMQNIHWSSDALEKRMLTNFGDQIGLTNARTPETITTGDELIIPLNFQSLDNISKY